ncbi:MAG TPA: hypothetical protein VKW78_02895 [Terriglobales bacterium]|nr:hypothetical protein [Terriglobales bacterium]
MPENASIRRTSLVAGVAGIAGVLMIGMSFGINTGPPIGASEQQLITFAATHSRPVLWGAWLQSVGPLLIMGFALTLVHLANFHNKISGSLTLLGASILMMVSLAEVVCYMAALDAVPSSMGLIGNAVGHVIQHLYFIVAAPAVFIPLGIVIRGSRVLPRVFGTLAILLGTAFFVLGVKTLYDQILSPAVTSFAAIQALWWLSAAIALMLRSRTEAELTNAASVRASS